MRQRSEQIQNAEIDTRGLAGRGIGRIVVEVAVEVVEAEKSRGRGGGVEVVGCGREAAVRGAVSENGVWGCKAVDFDAHERKRSPAGEGPGAGGSRAVSRWRQMGIARGETYIPQTETRMVANRKDLTNGARDIAAAKMRWLIVQAVRRSGLLAFTALMKEASIGGGRGVKPRFSSSGDLTIHGRMMEPANVMMEKMTKESEPIRPMSPRVSVEAWAAAGFE